MSVQNLGFAHFIVVLGAAGCVFVTRRELRVQPMRPSHLLQMPLLVGCMAVAPVILDPADVRDPAIWAGALVAGLLIGAVRGIWLRLQVDHMWSLIRLPQVPEAVWIVGLVLLLAACEIAAALAGPAGAAYRPLTAAALAACTGYLGGRAATIAIRKSRASHFELRRP